MKYASQSTEWNEVTQTRYYSNNFTNLQGDIVYVILPGQMVVNQNTYKECEIYMKCIYCTAVVDESEE